MFSGLLTLFFAGGIAVFAAGGGKVVGAHIGASLLRQRGRYRPGEGPFTPTRRPDEGEMMAFAILKDMYNINMSMETFCSLKLTESEWKDLRMAILATPIPPDDAKTFHEERVNRVLSQVPRR